MRRIGSLKKKILTYCICVLAKKNAVTLCLVKISEAFTLILCPLNNCIQGSSRQLILKKKIVNSSVDAIEATLNNPSYIFHGKDYNYSRC